MQFSKFSSIIGDIKFSYKREDLIDFNNKVNIKAKFSESSLAIQDLKKFYAELSGEHNLDFNGNLDGTLNNFGLEKFKLTTIGGIKIEGDLSRKIEEFFDDLGNAIFHMWLCHIFSVNLRIWMSISNCIRTTTPLQH